MEANGFLAEYTEENVFQGIKQLAASARRFAEI